MNPNLDTGVGRLNTTGGMPIAEILRYAAFRERGVGKEADRCKLLEQHRARVLTT
jgi:hypothetical protein